MMTSVPKLELSLKEVFKRPNLNKLWNLLKKAKVDFLDMRVPRYTKYVKMGNIKLEMMAVAISIEILTYLITAAETTRNTRSFSLRLKQRKEKH